jgi:hypothetical protein
VSGDDFLPYFTWPVDADGNRLRWTDLPVDDKLWNGERADKGGFIQGVLGLEAEPFPAADGRCDARARLEGLGAGLTPSSPASDTRRALEGSEAAAGALSGSIPSARMAARSFWRASWMVL